jgi:hypothetical protein
MQKTAHGIAAEVKQASAAMLKLDPEQTVIKPRPEKWSKQEILGHLIDSAVNNYHRFVRAQHGAAADFPCYQQDNWVAAQHYNERPLSELVELWAVLNTQLVHIIERIPANMASAPVNFNEDQPAALEYVVKDYLVHMRYHLRQIVEG